MWDDYPIGRPGRFAVHYDDFFTFTVSDWTITTTEGGSGDATEALTDETNGVLLITNDDADNDSDELQHVGEAFLPAAGKRIYFEALVKVSDVDDTDLFVGLAQTDTTLIDGATNAVFFRSDDGDAALDGVARASSTETATTGMVNYVDATYVKLGFKIVGTSYVEYWVDDVQRGTVKTNIPTTELRVSFGIQNGSGTADTLSIDYFIAAQER
jgi:hypothetical protein